MGDGKLLIALDNVIMLWNFIIVDGKEVITGCGCCIVCVSVLFYGIAAILAYLQYDKTGSNVILAGLIIGLLPAAGVIFGCVCIAICDKSAVPIMTIFFLALGGLSLTGAILIFVGVGQEAKKSNSDVNPDYNQSKLIAAGVLFALSGLFHCIGCACYGIGFSESEGKQRLSEIFS